jgi:hypothetical protein
MAGSRAVALALAAVLAIAVAGCGGSSSHPKVPSAKVEYVNGQHRVLLTRQAAARIGIQTAAVQATGGSRSLDVIPYSALLYTANGKTFTYIRSSPLVYVRQQVIVDHLTSSQAFLSSGPPPGTAVVTVGGEELHGAETGIQTPE